MSGEWISVRQQMPDDEITVLIHTPGSNEPVWFGYHDGDDGWRLVDGMPIDGVSHWMDLPEPPVTGGDT